MEFTNLQVMKDARSALKGKWLLACGAGFAVLLINMILRAIGHVIRDPLSFIVASILEFIISSALFLGLNILSLKIIKKEDPHFEDVFRGFNYFNKIIPIAILFLVLWFMIGFLLSVIVDKDLGWIFIIPLCFIVFIKLMWSQVYFILIENPTMNVIDILIQSKNMMHGYKWQLFGLGLMLAGLGFLCVFTLGIGFIWLIPYMYTCYAQFYLELKKCYQLTN